jgi:mannosyltransferase
MRFSRWLIILLLLLALAFALRIYRLDSTPLRGDEAFAVRYWASSPLDIIDSSWGESEPHPFGTYLAFWGWKAAAGDSEFAMRYLPLLGNLIGVAAIAALGRRLFDDPRIGLIAAALWAVNPYLIWHAQDARNYALWAGLSVLATWLFIRTADTNRPRHWGFYIAAQVLALYVFFLEAVLLLIQGIYLLVFRRKRPVLLNALTAWLTLGVLLLPWMAHLWWLSGSDYSGAVRDASLPELLTWFLPTLLIGDDLAVPWSTLLPLAWIALVGVGLALAAHRSTRRITWLATWIVLPAALLLIVATQKSVFHPRYLIAITPALLLLMAAALRPLAQARARPWPAAVTALLLVTPLLGVSTLYDYYRGDDSKSPNWPALASYLENRVYEHDLIVNVLPDPAFGYYLTADIPERGLSPHASAAAQLRPELNFYDAIWLVGRKPEAEQFLANNLQQISRHAFGNFMVTQYRRPQTVEREVDTTVDVTFGEGQVRLAGYTIQGPDTATPATVVMLYWQDLPPTSNPTYKASVQLIGPDQTMRDQAQDHPPQAGRDPYNLLKAPAPSLAAGTYSIQVVVYPAGAPDAPLHVFDADGTDLGTTYTLHTFAWPP